MNGSIFKGLSKMYEKTEQFEKYEEMMSKNLEIKEKNDDIEQLSLDYINFGIYYQNNKKD